MTTLAPRIARAVVGLPGAVGFSWGTEPGVNRPLYWEAEIEKTSGSVPSKVKIDFYNLAASSLAMLEVPGSVIQIIAGETTPSQLTYADIPKRGVWSEVKAPDIVTTVRAAEGQRIYREGHVAVSYPGGITRSQVMLDVMAALRCTVGYVDPTIPERTYPEATCWVGKGRDILDRLWAPDGGIWWLDGQTLNIVGPLLGSGLPGNAPVISAATGMHGSPSRSDKGTVEVTTNLLPALRPGQPFALAARFAKGNYRATKVAHNLNSWGTIWETKISGVPWQ